MPTKTRFELKLGAPTREAFGRTLAELGRENKDVVVCDADLSKSTMTAYFAKDFPDRFFECGIAEADMVGIGAGLATSGKIAFVSSFSAFVLNKGFEQLRVLAAYPNVNLKVVGTHSGISIGEDGPSQMSVEEIGLACSLAGFVVMAPADENECRQMLYTAFTLDTPVAVRYPRGSGPGVAVFEHAARLGRSRASIWKSLARGIGVRPVPIRSPSQPNGRRCGYAGKTRGGGFAACQNKGLPTAWNQQTDPGTLRRRSLHCTARLRRPPGRGCNPHDVQGVARVRSGPVEEAGGPDDGRVRHRPGGDHDRRRGSLHRSVGWDPGGGQPRHRSASEVEPRPSIKA